MNDTPVFGLQQDSDGIYGHPPISQAHKSELTFRESITYATALGNTLKAIGKHHSIPVMDREVRRFIKQLPLNARIVDVGGGWGWHWRNLYQFLPDIQVFLVDLARSNLMRAKVVLEPQVGSSVFLVHGDALALEFPANSFDGYWSGQTLQHIPDLGQALDEARRVLKVGGKFANYSLNVQPIIRLMLRAVRRPYVTDGEYDDHLYLRRATRSEEHRVSECFNALVSRRFSEFLFQPNLRTTFTGREHSMLGKLDSFLSTSNRLLGSLARQQSFHCVTGAKVMSAGHLLD